MRGLIGPTKREIRVFPDRDEDVERASDACQRPIFFCRVRLLPGSVSLCRAFFWPPSYSVSSMFRSTLQLEIAHLQSLRFADGIWFYDGGIVDTLLRNISVL